MKKLKTAEHAVLNAVGQLGHGNVHELVEASGYARSTVDKALKALADAGMIVEYDTGADPAEGTPTRWQLTDDDASAPIGTDAENASDDSSLADPDTGEADNSADGFEADEHDATDEGQQDSAEDGEQDGADGQDDDDEVDAAEEDEGGDGEDPDGDAAPVRRPGNRRVMQIAGALVGYPDGADAEELARDSGVTDPALTRLLAAMVSGGAAVAVAAEEGLPPRWKSGTTRAADIDPDPVIVRPRCEVCQRAFPADWTPAATDSEPENGRKTPDSRVLILAGSMVAYPNGVNASQLVDDTRMTPQMVSQLLEAMHTAGVAERVIIEAAEGQPGQRLWVLKPGPLNTVEPEPKCSGCRRPRPGVRSSSRTTPVGTRRADALPRGVLRDATMAFILARPGIVLSPGAIAAALTVELNRDVVSPGAVKDSCVHFAGEGKILQVSDKPWLFSTRPGTAQDSDGDGAEADQADLLEGGQQDSADAEADQADALEGEQQDGAAQELAG